MHISKKFYLEDKPKNSNQISYSIGFRKGKEKTINKTINSACEVFAEMLIELCPELLGYGYATKKWEDEFKSKLKEKL
jgi:hypothetical protein